MKAALKVVVGALVAVLMVEHSAAQPYPSKLIRLVSPAAIGGSLDVSARQFAPHFERLLGQPVIVDSKPGANQIIGTRYVVGSAPDGYTLLFSTVLAAHPLFNKTNGVEAVKELTPISNVLTVQLMLFTSAKLPVTSWKELHGYSRANPGALNYASPNAPSFLLYLAVLANRAGGFPFTTVGYKGGPESLTALVTGESHFSLGVFTTYRAQIRAGTIRPLFILASTRSSLAPEVPTAEEVGIRDLNAVIYYGLWAPKGTPPEIIKKLNSAAIAVTKNPEFVKQVLASGAEPLGSTPEETLRDAQADVRLFTEAAALINFKPQ